jgi:imidazolonepropionase-like amidohydrolase
MCFIPLRNVRHLLLCTCIALTPQALADTVAIRGATLLPITSTPIADGTLIIKDGKIVAVGPASSTPVPDGARVIDGSNRIIMPGIVDTHSHLGVAGDHAESSSAVTPQLRILDSFWAADPRIKVARSGGITTANVMPGSGNVIGGQTIYIKLRDGSAEDLLVEGSVGGMKMANGENPKGHGSRKGPDTRMASAALARQKFYDAITYGEKKAAAKRDRKAKAPDLDLGLEALQEVLNGSRVVHHHTHRTDDIMTVLRLQREFGFRLVLQHGLESYKIAADLAREPNLELSYLILDSPGGKQEAFDVLLSGAAQLEQAGFEIALHSDDWVIDSRFLLRSAALAVRGGMSREAALRALTINPARMMDLDERVGSLEIGKDADFVVLDGDPFSVYTHVQQTWVDGQALYDRSKPKHRLYATGGFHVADRYPYLAEDAQ